MHYVDNLVFKGPAASDWRAVNCTSSHFCKVHLLGQGCLSSRISVVFVNHMLVKIQICLNNTESFASASSW